MEHNLFALILRENAVLPCLPKLGVQSSPVATMLRQLNPLANYSHERLQSSRVNPITKQRLFGCLSNLLVDAAKLEVVHQQLPDNRKRN